MILKSVMGVLLSIAVQTCCSCYSLGRQKAKHSENILLKLTVFSCTNLQLFWICWNFAILEWGVKSKRHQAEFHPPEFQHLAYTWTVYLVPAYKRNSPALRRNCLSFSDYCFNIASSIFNCSRTLVFIKEWKANLRSCRTWTLIVCMCVFFVPCLHS